MKTISLLININNTILNIYINIFFSITFSFAFRIGTKKEKNSVTFFKDM